MSTEQDPNVGAPPETWGQRFRQIGPGMMAAATGVGAGDLVATMVAGSKYGYALLWAVILGAVFKLALGEAVGRWHLASGQTILSGWRTLGKWALWYFGVYAVVWGFSYGATAMSASGLPLNAMFPGLSVRYWAILCGLAGFLLVWFGRYALLEKVMTVLVGVMFVTVVGTAVLVAPNLGDVFSGFVPTVPEGSVAYLLGLIGGVGGTITLAAYGYWTFAKGWRGPSWLPMMRTDNAVGYVTTGIFVIAMLVVGAEMLAGQSVVDDDEGLLILGDKLASDYGQWARLPFLVGFFTVSFSSVIGVWNGVSLMFTDWWRTVRLPKDAEIPVQSHADLTRTVAFRGYVLWLTFPPMVLLFLDKPFLVTVTYGVLGALFMPFLAITMLLLLNSSRVPSQGRSGYVSNFFLGMCVLLFIYVAYDQLVGVFT